MHLPDDCLSWYNRYGQSADYRQTLFWLYYLLLINLYELLNIIFVKDEYKEEWPATKKSLMVL